MAVGAQRRARNRASSAKASSNGVEIGDLAADMHVDADDFEARKLGGQRIDFARAADRDAELVLGLAGRDLGVGLGVDIGVDAHARRARALALPVAIDESSCELGFGFDIDAKNAFIDSERELRRRLADAGKHDFSGGMPAARARLSSPPETTSAPAPRSASVLMTA